MKPSALMYGESQWFNRAYAYTLTYYDLEKVCEILTHDLFFYFLLNREVVNVYLFLGEPERVQLEEKTKGGADDAPGGHASHPSAHSSLAYVEEN